MWKIGLEYSIIDNKTQKDVYNIHTKTYSNTSLTLMVYIPEEYRDPNNYYLRLCFKNTNSEYIGTCYIKDEIIGYCSIDSFESFKKYVNFKNGISNVYYGRTFIQYNETITDFEFPITIMLHYKPEKPKPKRFRLRYNVNVTDEEVEFDDEVSDPTYHP